MKIHKHNKEAYKRIKNAFKTSKRTCVVQPTGTGKSYIALQWIKDNPDKKFLYLTSYNSIKRQAVSLINSELGATNVDVFTYRGILNQDITGYDAIVLDEFHRLGAKEWGGAVRKILESCADAQVLGLSATPIRYLDDKRDMSEELFNGNIASEMLLAQAIVHGILPAPKYVTCLYSMQDEYNRALSKMSKIKYKEKRDKASRLLERAKSYLEQSKGLEEVFREHMSNKSGRYIIFCKDISHMNKMLDESDKWFKGVNENVNKYVVFSDAGRSASVEEIEKFENDDSDSLKLLFCINMFNEGYHLSDISGVVLLRPTESPNIYLQQIGRALSTNNTEANNENPLIIDVVGNVSCMKESELLESEINALVNTESSAFDSEFRVISMMSDFVSVLREVNSLTDFTFYDWIELCKEFKKEYGHLNITRDLLPDGKYSGMPLYSWTRYMRQRNSKGLLSDEQKRVCEEIGLNLDRFFIVREWDDMYNHCLEYLRVTGKKFISDKDVYNDVLVGRWCTTQLGLNRSGKLSEDKAEKLSHLVEKSRFLCTDIDDLNNKRWMEMYERVSELGVMNLSTRSTEYNWFVKQLALMKRNKLSADKISLINRLGYLSKSDRFWNKGYALLKEIYDATGCADDVSFFKGDANKIRSVKRFIAKNRKEFREDTLNSWKIDLLNEINFEWRDVDEKYKRMHDLISEYFDLYGSVGLTQKTEYKGEKIGVFFRDLRDRYLSGSLSEKFVNMFDDLMKIWEQDRKSGDEAWNDIFGLLKDYIDTYGVLPKSRTMYKGCKIGSWFFEQRNRYRNGKLFPDRVEKLRNAGVLPDEDGSFRSYICTPDDLKWNKRFEVYVKYKSGSGTLSEKDRKAIISWACAQRKRYADGKLSQYRANKLKEIGF